jgi:hypothetical protein
MTSNLKSLNMKKTTTYDVGLVLAWDSHKNVAGLTFVMCISACIRTCHFTDWYSKRNLSGEREESKTKKCR